MSGHSKWAKIKHKKGAEDAKRGALFTKISKEITAAAKDKGGNIDTNIRLRAAVARAREYNMPQNNVENAIKKGTGELPGVVFENVTFDARLGTVAFLVECLTDNKNRTTAEIRNLLNKKGGSLGGSNAHLFSKKGYFVIEKAKADESALYDLVGEGGADDIAEEGDSFEVTCEPVHFEAVKRKLDDKKTPAVTAEVTMLPKAEYVVKVEGSTARAVLALVEEFQDHEDVQNVYANFDISDEEMAKISAE